jgi:hypothetical protein
MEKFKMKVALAIAASISILTLSSDVNAAPGCGKNMSLEPKKEDAQLLDRGKK